MHDQAGIARAARGTRCRGRRSGLVCCARGQGKTGAGHTEQIFDGFGSIHGLVPPNGLFLRIVGPFSGATQEQTNKIRNY